MPFVLQLRSLLMCLLTDIEGRTAQQRLPAAMALPFVIRLTGAANNVNPNGFHYSIHRIFLRGPEKVSQNHISFINRIDIN